MQPYLGLSNGVQTMNSAGGANMDDSNLKAYYKFNETSGTVTNQSVSVDTLGTSADCTVTGATYNQVQLPFGAAMLFDGVNDYAVLSSSLSLWNWIHSTTANYTINYWVRIVSTANNEFLLGTAHTDDAGAGLRHRQNTSNVIDQYMTEGSSGGTVCSNPSATSYFSTGTDYMVTLRYDQSLGTLNAKQRLNDGADTTANKTAKTPLNGDANNPFTIAKNPASASDYGNFYIAELSMWERQLTEAEIEELYNGGDGLAIY